MRTRWFVLAVTALFFGALGGAIFAPQPAGAVNRDMIELQQTVTQIQQAQQDLRSTIDANNASIKTLIQQSIDSVNQMNSQMGVLQKTVQEVQANTGSRIDTMTQQTQGLSDNLQDVQARVGKLSQQLTDMQNLLQGIDAKVSNAMPASGTPGGAPTTQGYPSPGATGGYQTPNPNMPASQAPSTASPNGPASTYPSTYPGQAAPGPGGATGSGPNGAGSAATSPYGAPGGMSPAAMPPISADTLYKNALRDFTSGNYDLSHQEFSDYIRNFPSNDLASNSEFYLGEIAYAQGDYKGAINAYDTVLTNYPQSFKLASSLLKKAQAELEVGMKTTGVRDLRDVVRRFPGSDESRRAQAKLHEMGLSVTPHPTTPH